MACFSFFYETLKTLSIEKIDTVDEGGIPIIISINIVSHFIQLVFSTNVSQFLPS